jgi:hypothetical protein
MKKPKQYVIESKGFNYAKNSLERKKAKLEQSYIELAKEMGITVDELKKEIN